MPGSCRAPGPRFPETKKEDFSAVKPLTSHTFPDRCDTEAAAAKICQRVALSGLLMLPPEACCTVPTNAQLTSKHESREEPRCTLLFIAHGWFRLKPHVGVQLTET